MINKIKNFLIISVLLSCNLFAFNNNLPINEVISIQIKNFNLILPKLVNKNYNISLQQVMFNKNQKKIIYKYSFTKKNQLVEMIEKNNNFKNIIKRELSKNIKLMYKNDDFVNLIKKNNIEIIHAFYYKNKKLFEIKN